MKPQAIRSMREGLKWTQAQLAAYLGVTPRTVQNYEAGNPLPKPTGRLLRRLREDPPAELPKVPKAPKRKKRRRKARS